MTPWVALGHRDCRQHRKDIFMAYRMWVLGDFSGQHVAVVIVVVRDK